MSTARYYHTATSLLNGQVLVVSGVSPELYDPATGVWTATGSMNIGRDDHTATLLPGGQALAAGGFDHNGDVTAELYDPATGMWTGTGSMASGRTRQTATLLLNGQVLVAGSNADPGSAEIYDPASGSWMHTKNLSPLALFSYGDITAQRQRACLRRRSIRPVWRPYALATLQISAISP